MPDKRGFSKPLPDCVTSGRERGSSLYRRLGGASELVLTYVVVRKSFASTGVRIRGHPARSDALYGLRYSGTSTVHVTRRVLCFVRVVTLLLVGCWSGGD